MNSDESPSKQLILQRVRNRIIEYFEFASDAEAQAKFGPDSVINYWEDWQNSSLDTAYPNPVFTVSERDAMSAFDSSWRLTADSTSNPMPPISVLRDTRVWQRLTTSAIIALSVFLLRGRFPEDHEVTT